MSRYLGPACRLCRREGLKLFLKGQKCLTEKCIFNKRKRPPGNPTTRRPKKIGYILQLREKQKTKRVYGVMEKPFRNYFKKAQKLKGITGENLLILLELRLDNAIYRMGIASSRSQARNFIADGHIYVNNKKVDIASYSLKIGDTISIGNKMKESHIIKNNVEVARGVGLIADWLDIAEDGLSCAIKNKPTRDNVDISINEQVIVELYSK